MSKSALNIIILLVLTLSSGCVIKNGHICGPQTPVANCDSDNNRRLLHPEPLGDYWIKGDKVTEIRRQDWIDCGGDIDGSYRSLTDDEVSRKDRSQAWRSNFYKVQNCMIEKDYRYMGICRGEIPSTSFKMNF